MNYIITGIDEYLIQEKSNLLIDQLLDEVDEMNLITYNGLDFDVDSFLSDARSFPFFGDSKVLVVENSIFLSSASKMTESHENMILEYLEDSNETTSVIFKLNGSLDKRKKFVKNISKLTKLVEIAPLKDYEFNKLVERDLNQARIKLDRKTMGTLLSRLPIDLLNWKNELNKLTCYPNTIDEEVVNKIISRTVNDDVFKVMDTILKKDLKNCLMTIDDLMISNVSPIALLALLSSNFRLLYQVSYYINNGLSEEEIAKILLIHPYRVKLACASVNKIKADNLLKILNDLSVLDYRFKSFNCDSRLEFELFLIKLMEFEYAVN